MTNPLKEKFGFFKELVDLFSKSTLATISAILTISVIYLVKKNDQDKDKLYGMVIQEVRKQVPKEVNKQVAPIKEANDSANAKVDTTLSNINNVTNSINDFLKKKK